MSCLTRPLLAKVLAILRTHPNQQQIHIFYSSIVNELKYYTDPDQGTYMKILRTGFEAYAKRADTKAIKVKNRGKRVEHGDLWLDNQVRNIPADSLKHENMSSAELVFYQKTTMVRHNCHSLITEDVSSWCFFLVVLNLFLFVGEGFT